VRVFARGEIETRGGEGEGSVREKRDERNERKTRKGTRSIDVSGLVSDFLRMWFRTAATKER
jgi:hypothetical protein